MIRLTLFNELGERAYELESSDFRISGGVIWKAGSGGLIVRCTGDHWQYEGNYYPRLCVEGRCRLLFGIARAPTALSEPIGVFSITGSLLRANGVPFAQYVEEFETWQGLSRPIWWQAMRIFSDGALPLDVEDARIPMLNPWDATASAADAAFARPELIARGRPARSDEQSY